MQMRAPTRNTWRAPGALAIAMLVALALGCRGSGDAKPDPKSQSTMQQSEQPKPGSDKLGEKLDPGTAPAPATPSERPESAPEGVTLAAGTTLTGSLGRSVSTKTSHVGDPVNLRTVAAVRLHQQTVVPAGSTIRGEVTHVNSAGRMRGASELTLRFNELVLPNGKSYPIDCEPFRVKTKGEGKETAEEIGGGAAAGGLLGGIIGGKKSILKGAAIGAVLGTGVAVATKGDQIVLPAGQKLKVTLTAPVRISPVVSS